MEHKKKKSLRRYLGWGVLALLVIWLAAMPMLARQNAKEEGPAASILTAQAEIGTIAENLHGGGTVSADDAQQVKLPADVKLKAFLVKNGDTVAAGDPLAAVDKVSVMTAITQIQSAMETVKKQMAALPTQKGDTALYAPAAGRVKAVYAQVGQSVESAMLQNSALVLLSLDDKMAVTLQVAAPLSVGDRVEVTLADGTALQGTVSRNLEGKLTVTVADNGYAPGQTVTVGTLGTGTLEIHSPWAAVAFTGTVSGIRVQENQKVNAGAALLTLKDTDFTAQSELLAQTHRDYEEQLQRLFQMYTTGYLTAPCDGMVSGLDRESPHLLSAEEAEYTLVFLSQVTPVCTKDDACQVPGTGEHIPGCPRACTRDDACQALTHFENCPHNCTLQPGCHAKMAFHKDGCPEKCTRDTGCRVTDPSQHQPDCPRRCTNVPGCTAAYHLDTCPEKCTGDASCKASRENHRTGCPKRCTCDENCTATDHWDGCPKIVTEEYVGMVAVVTQVLPEQKALFLAVNENSAGKVIHTNKWDYSALDIDAALGGVLPGKTPYSVENPGLYQTGDVVIVARSEKDGSVTILPTGRKSSSGGSTAMPDLGSLMGSLGGLAGMYGGQSGQQETLYDAQGDTVLSLIPQSDLTLTIRVDESDISRMTLGMEAAVTLPALPGQVFSGTVTRIAQTGTGNGGSSKFQVELTVPHQTGMLPGMSASAIVPLGKTQDVLTLPAAAIQESSGKTFVYTALDKKTAQPTAPVEVTLGASDGQTVEIRSGLTPGQPVYYPYYDTPEESDAVETSPIPGM